MPGEIRVPELGESVVEVTVQRWLKAEGESVEEGEPLVEIETEKANVEITAEESGVLARIEVPDGETVEVGQVIGTIGDGAARAGAEATQAAAAQAETPPEPAAQTQSPNGSQAAPAPVAEDREAAPTGPAARRFAEEHGVDLAAIRGSGRGGRILKEDVEEYLQQQDQEAAATPQPEAMQAPAEAQPAPRPAPSPAPSRPAPSPVIAPREERESRERMTRRRQTIARRLVEAQQTAAMLTTFNECDMSAVMELRRRRKDSFREKHGVGLGFMSFFTKAVVGALKEFPYVNAEIQGDEVVVKGYYDIGIAVGAEEGLVVPVVRDADRKSFAALEREIADLAGRAREGKLGLAELTGGTFTITNGGVYGSLMSTPILNAPQVGILGMHAIKERPVVLNGEIAVRAMMYLALSYDHRLVDGSTAVRFLVRIKEMIEDPETLLLEG